MKTGQEDTMEEGHEDTVYILTCQRVNQEGQKDTV